MATGRSRQARHATRIVAIGLLALPVIWTIGFRPASLRQLLAEISGYSIHGAVYDPRLGKTIGGFSGSGPEVRLDGVLKHALLVAQREGRRISRISRDGRVVWTRAMDHWVSGLELAEDALLFSGSSIVGALDPADGRVLWRDDLGFSVAGIGLAEEGVLIAPFGEDAPLMTADYRGSARQGIAPPVSLDDANGFAYARHATAIEDELLVADTFNHRVVGIEEPAARPDWQIDAFFPNQVQLKADGSVLVVEEHANRIVQHDPATGESSVLLSCEHPLFRNLHGPDAIRARQHETARTPPFGFGARSVCDARLDPESLYSPNGFQAIGDSTIYVADTDNHRVAMFDSETGSVQATVTGLNSPIRVIAVPAAPVEEGY